MIDRRMTVLYNYVKVCWHAGQQLVAIHHQEQHRFQHKSLDQISTILHGTLPMKTLCIRIYCP